MGEALERARVARAPPRDGEPVDAGGVLGDLDLDRRAAPVEPRELEVVDVDRVPRPRSAGEVDRPAQAVRLAVHLREVDPPPANGRPEVDGEGRYTGKLEFYAYGEGKAVAMRELADRDELDLTASYAYSDSATDPPMLEAVGHPVVVNPDRELREVAEQRDWQIMEFDRPVTLRTRLATVPKQVPVVSGAAAAGGIAAALAVWVLRTRKRTL